jgi:hypothetical protein
MVSSIDRPTHDVCGDVEYVRITLKKDREFQKEKQWKIYLKFIEVGRYPVFSIINF